MESETAEVHRPCEVRKVVDDEGPRRRAVRRADDGGTEPRRCVLGNPLLEERRPGRAVRVALHEDGPPSHRAHDRLADREVVAQQIQLGLAPLGKQHLARAREPQLVAVDLELDRVLRARHGQTVSPP